MNRTRKYRKGQIILYGGEATNAVFVVKSGIVRAYSISENGNEVIIALFGAGDYFPSFHSEHENPIALFYYDVLHEAEIERVPFAEFVSNATTQPILLQEKRYIGALLHISAVVQASADKKIAHTLRYLAVRFKAPMPTKIYTRIDIKLTQQNIADICNTSRETTNIELGKLKSAGMITERNKYYSVDLRKLNKRIGEDLSISL
ncbi:Crp/Fnr family transcriptional regulator [Candidatus Saccharibacteria bacterium]|nr:Crp/Fnr family transcriptional regulator [Candidatus Saccharibacteria bacterium]